MTPIADMFLSYEPCITRQNLQNANGTTLAVDRIGSMHVERISLLSRALHIPRLFFSLVSTHKIAKLEEYGIIFVDTNIMG